MPKPITSVYKGVCWVKNTKKFKAAVRYGGKVYECGFYDNPLEAARARDKLIMRMGFNVKLQIFKPIKP